MHQGTTGNPGGILSKRACACEGGVRSRKVGSVPEQALPWTEVTANIDTMQRATIQIEPHQVSSRKVTGLGRVAGVPVATAQPVAPA